MKWTEQCSALRRDGRPCQAPAIKGGFVCRRHGGSTQAAQIAARRRLLQERLMQAIEAYQDAQGTSREFERLCAVNEAQRRLEDYEVEAGELARKRAALRRAEAARKRAPDHRHDGGDGTRCSRESRAAHDRSEQEGPPAEARHRAEPRSVRPDAADGPRAGATQRSPWA